MSETTTLAQCPIGLFLHEGELCLKTEYGNNEGRIDAYIVSTGEFFWGHAPQTIANQREQIVTPVEWTAAAARGEVHAVAVAVLLPNGKTQLALNMSTASIAEAKGNALSNFEDGYQLLASVAQSTGAET